MFGSRYINSNELDQAACTAPHPPRRRAALAISTTLDATSQRRKGSPSHESCYPKAGDAEVGWSRADDAGGPGAQWLGRVVTKVRCRYKMASGWSSDAVGIGFQGDLFFLKVLGTLVIGRHRKLQALLGEIVGLDRLGITVHESQRFSRIIHRCAFWTYS